MYVHFTCKNSCARKINHSHAVSFRHFHCIVIEVASKYFTLSMLCSYGSSIIHLNVPVHLTFSAQLWVPRVLYSCYVMTRGYCKCLWTRTLIRTVSVLYFRMKYQKTKPSRHLTCDWTTKGLSAYTLTANYW